MIRDIGIWFLYIIINCFVIAVVVVAAAYIDAYFDVKSRPREPMSWCWKHGFFRKQHALRIPLGPEENYEICPQCYKQAVWGKK